MFLPDTTVVRGLSFPTPHLEEFSFHSLQGNFTILPETPHLTIFDVAGLDIPTFPDLGNIEDLRIDGCGASFDEIAVARAINVVCLDIRSWPPFRLAGTHPRLRTLRIEGTISEDCLKTFSAPNLSDLTLAVDTGRDYLHIISCRGIDLNKLKSASIGWPHRIEDDTVAQYLEGIRHFLESAACLETLDIQSKYMASLVLKLLTHECEWLYQSHPVVLVLDETEMELGRGEARLSSVNRFREMTGCTADSSWDDIFESLAGALEF